MLGGKCRCHSEDVERSKTLILFGKRNSDRRRVPIAWETLWVAREVSTHDLPGFVGDLLESRGCARRGSDPDRSCGRRFQLLSVAVGQCIKRALPRRVGGVDGGPGPSRASAFS